MTSSGPNNQTLNLKGTERVEILRGAEAATSELVYWAQKECLLNIKNADWI